MEGQLSASTRKWYDASCIGQNIKPKRCALQCVALTYLVLLARKPLFALYVYASPCAKSIPGMLKDSTSLLFCCVAPLRCSSYFAIINAVLCRARKWRLAGIALFTYIGTDISSTTIKEQTCFVITTKVPKSFCRVDVVNRRFEKYTGASWTLPFRNGHSMKYKDKVSSKQATTIAKHQVTPAASPRHPLRAAQGPAALPSEASLAGVGSPL